MNSDPMAHSEFEPQRITHQEAAEMVELWTRENEDASGTVDLQDVIEVLCISETEGQRLLSQVRNAPENTRIAIPDFAKIFRMLFVSILLFFLALMCLLRAVQLIWVGNESRGETKVLEFFGVFAAIAILWYYRRTAAQFFGGLGRRTAQGKS